MFINCNVDCTNEGIIQWEQVGGSQATDVQWRNRDLIAAGTLTPNNNIINNGAFRLINTIFFVDTDIKGVGCFQIDDGSTFYLRSVNAQNPTRSNYFLGQSIAFTGTTATIHVDPLLYSENDPTFGARIYGFFDDAVLEFRDTITDFSYSILTGFLRVTMSTGKFVNLNIGLGYNSNNFFRTTSSRTGTTFNAIQYSGSSFPQILPPACALTAPRCAPLQPLCTTGYSGTVTSTTTIAPSGTDPGTVLVLTPLPPLTTRITTLPPGATGFTSTIGPSGTSLGEIIVGFPSQAPSTTVCIEDYFCDTCNT